MLSGGSACDSTVSVCVCVCGEDADCLCHLFPQHTIRALALRVLKEILRNQPARFKNYAELTIMKTLEAHKDSHKEVHNSHPKVQSTKHYMSLF